MITRYKIFNESNLIKLMNYYNNDIISDVIKILVDYNITNKYINISKGRGYFQYYIDINIDRFLYKEDTGKDICSKDFQGDIKKVEYLIKKKLDVWENKLLKKEVGILLSYRLDTNYHMDRTNYLISYLDIRCEIHLRDFRTSRVIPNRYIYHCSPISNRSSIKERGLELKGSKDSPEWKDEMELSYPPSVFATNCDINNLWDLTQDIWRIDTKGLSNKWYKDINFKNEIDHRFPIMTFESIPPEHLKLM